MWTSSYRKIQRVIQQNLQMWDYSQPMEAIIVNIDKGKEDKKLENKWWISLSNSISKVFEKIIFRRFHNEFVQQRLRQEEDPVEVPLTTYLS